MFFLKSRTTYWRWMLSIAIRKGKPPSVSEICAAAPCAGLTQRGEGWWCPSKDQRAALHVTSSTCWVPPAPNCKIHFQGRDAALLPLIIPHLWSSEGQYQAGGAGWCLGWTTPMSPCLYVCLWVLWINTYSYRFLLACSLLSSFLLHLTAGSSPVSGPKFPRLSRSFILHVHSTCRGGPHAPKRWEEKGTLCFH